MYWIDWTHRPDKTSKGPCLVIDYFGSHLRWVTQGDQMLDGWWHVKNVFPIYFHHEKKNIWVTKRPRLPVSPSTRSLIHCKVLQDCSGVQTHPRPTQWFIIKKCSEAHLWDPTSSRIFGAGGHRHACCNWSVRPEGIGGGVELHLTYSEWKGKCCPRSFEA